MELCPVSVTLRCLILRTRGVELCVDTQFVFALYRVLLYLLYNIVLLYYLKGIIEQQT